MKRLFLAVTAALVLAGCPNGRDLAPAVPTDVDIYDCVTTTEVGPVELIHTIISCPDGQSPKSGNGACTLIGDGRIDAPKVDTEKCE